MEIAIKSATADRNRGTRRARFEIEAGIENGFIPSFDLPKTVVAGVTEYACAPVWFATWRAAGKSFDLPLRLSTSLCAFA